MPWVLGRLHKAAAYNVACSECDLQTEAGGFIVVAGINTR